MAELFLSRLILNPLNRQVRRDLGNCQELHRTILSAFPQKDNGAGGARSQFGILYRIEMSREHSRPATLLVQSTVKPDWSRLVDGYLQDTYGDFENPACKAIGHRYQELRAGAAFAFRLRANPTRRVSGKNTKDDQKWYGKRVELLKEEHQVEWLDRKAAASGFKILSLRLNPELPNLRTSPEDKTFGWRVGDTKQKVENKKHLVFASILFEGTLVITDINLFRETLESGIGSGKAYGFGLLSISRLPE
ncbi:type I-E CRISPR-associated protein Cas6/Cse3/CasE [bacterium]|nr:type I-E CRISPR-associated protein Cas6/Cse3/CasE [bacterium]MCI0560767.1 type I-E CRISPR-associated protein Cas6/Cse3/CasE [Nitrososphaera sp.]